MIKQQVEKHESRCQKSIKKLPQRKKVYNLIIISQQTSECYSLVLFIFEGKFKKKRKIKTKTVEGFNGVFNSSNFEPVILKERKTAENHRLKMMMTDDSDDP